MELYVPAVSDVHPGVGLVARFAVLQLFTLRDLLAGLKEGHPWGYLCQPRPFEPCYSDGVWFLPVRVS